MRWITYLLVSLLLLIGSCTTAKPINNNQGHQSLSLDSHYKAIAMSIPLGFFYSDKISKLDTAVKYFRTFGVDFKKPKIDGQYQYVDDARVEDFIQYTNAHHIKVIWTLFLTSTTLDKELAYVKNLIKRGMNICALEYGGEFYLRKYALGDVSKKGVVEKITPKIYLHLLKSWLPAFQKILPYPKVDHIIVGASHGNTNSKRDQQRKAWNLEVINPIKKKFPKYIDQLSWSFHLYAGRTAVRSPNGEEDIVSSLNFDFMKDFPAKMKIYVTESGYYVHSFSAEEMNKATQFWSAVYQHLRPGDVFGVHPLICKGHRKNPLCIYSLDGGLTPVGKQFEKWMNQRNNY